MKVIVNPMKKLLIQRDPLEPRTEICLEKFDERTLRWKKTKARLPLMELHIAKKVWENQGTIQSAGWIEVEDTTGRIENIIKTAMDKLKEAV